MIESVSKCFISYSWDDESRIKLFVHSLNNILTSYSVQVFLDIDDNYLAGSNISKFMNKIESADYVVVVISYSYLRKMADPSKKVYVEWQLILKELCVKDKVLPVIYNENCILPDELSDLCIAHIDINDIQNLMERITNKKIARAAIIQKFSEFDLLKHETKYGAYSKERLTSVALKYAAFFYPEIKWKVQEANNQIAIDENSFINIIDVNVPKGQQFHLGSICIEGYLNNQFRSVLIITNGFLSPKFKLAATTAFRSRNKHIILLDSGDINTLEETHPWLLKDDYHETSDDSSCVYEILSVNFIKQQDYDQMCTEILPLKEYAELKFEFKDYLCKLNEFVENEFYYIHLYMYAIEDIILEMAFNEDIAHFVIVREERASIIKLKKGFNNIYVQFRAISVGDFDAVLTLDKVGDNTSKHFNLGNYKIKKNIQPKIIFESQLTNRLKILNKIKESIKYKKCDLITLFASGGSGKSFLLNVLVNDLYSEYEEDVKVLRINFTNDRITDNKLLCDLLFLLCLDLPFEVDFEWMSYSDIAKLLVPENLLILIRNLLHSQSTTAILECLNKIDIEDGGLLEKNFHIAKRKVIMLDDIHKLSEVSSKVLEFVIEFFMPRELKFTFILAGREDETKFFSQAFLESSNEFRLGRMGISDIQKSVIETEPKLKKFVMASIIDSNFTNKVFYITDFIKRICNTEYRDLSDFNNYIRACNEEMKSNCYVRNVFAGLSDAEKDTLNATYACLKAFIHISADEFEKTHISSLSHKKLIINQSNYILHGHDIFLESYNVEYTKSLFRFLMRKYKEESCDLENIKILSMIIRCDDSNAQRLISATYEKMVGLYEQTEFYKAYYLCEALIQLMSLDKCHLFDNWQKANTTFIFANALNHMGKLELAYFNFKKVSEYKLLGEENIDALILEAKSEKINLDYWSLRTDIIVNEIDALTEEAESLLYLNSYTITKAYLNTFNRKMVTYLLLDDYENAEKQFSLCLEKCNEFQNEEYRGFAFMDYAKGLYNENPVKALELLNKAFDIFKNTNQVRRRLDCQCEIAFLECIFNPKNNVKMKELERAKDALKDNGLISQYEKAILKISVIRLLNNKAYMPRLIKDFMIFSGSNMDTSNLRKKLIGINLDVIHSRVTNQDIYCAIDWIKDIKIGNSYLSIVNHNLNVNFDSNCKIVLACNKLEVLDNSFVLDLRVW